MYGGGVVRDGLLVRDFGVAGDVPEVLGFKVVRVRVPLTREPIGLIDGAVRQ